jgi:hypothetical protein
MRTAIFALALSVLPLAAAAQSATVDPPTRQDVLDWLEARPGQMIHNYGCSRVDHRTFICEFDMPPGSQIAHVSIQAVWVGSGWSYSFRQ